LNNKIVLQKRWVYTLYQTDENYLLSVAFCNGSVDFSRKFQIDIKEINDEIISALAKDIVDNYQKYKGIEVF
jgi:hypothetical protein